jgi:hypothetical protein
MQGRKNRELHHSQKTSCKQKLHQSVTGEKKKIDFSETRNQWAFSGQSNKKNCLQILMKSGSVDTYYPAKCVGC